MVGASVETVIPKNIFPIPVPCVVGIADGSSLSPLPYSPDIEILDDVDYDFSMTKDIPGNLTGIRGHSGEPEGMINFKRVIFHRSQCDV